MKVLVVVSCLALGSAALAGGHGGVFSKSRVDGGHGDVFIVASN